MWMNVNILFVLGMGVCDTTVQGPFCLLWKNAQLQKTGRHSSKYAVRKIPVLTPWLVKMIGSSKSNGNITIGKEQTIFKTSKSWELIIKIFANSAINTSDIDTWWNHTLSHLMMFWMFWLNGNNLYHCQW